MLRKAGGSLGAAELDAVDGDRRRCRRQGRLDPLAPVLLSPCRRLMRKRWSAAHHPGTSVRFGNAGGREYYGGEATVALGRTDREGGKRRGSDGEGGRMGESDQGVQGEWTGLALIPSSPCLAAVACSERCGEVGHGDGDTEEGAGGNGLGRPDGLAPGKLLCHFSFLVFLILLINSE
jgi:hypothetical protein